MAYVDSIFDCFLVRPRGLVLAHLYQQKSEAKEVVHLFKKFRPLENLNG